MKAPFFFENFRLFVAVVLGILSNVYSKIEETYNPIISVHQQFVLFLVVGDIKEFLHFLT